MIEMYRSPPVTDSTWLQEMLRQTVGQLHDKARRSQTDDIGRQRQTFRQFVLSQQHRTFSSAFRLQKG